MTWSPSLSPGGTETCTVTGATTWAGVACVADQRQGLRHVVVPPASRHRLHAAALV